VQFRFVKINNYKHLHNRVAKVSAWFTQLMKTIFMVVEVRILIPVIAFAREADAFRYMCAILR